MKKLSIVIVNYNVKHYLDQCLKSVRASIEFCQTKEKSWDIESWVVDNASVDGSVDMVKTEFPEVKLIVNADNRGFSTANNQAIRSSESEYVLLLNPDTIVQEDTLYKVLQFMEAHPDGGGLGVKMLDGQGQFLPESKRGLPTPWVAFYKIFGFSKLFPKSKRFGKYHLGYLNKDENHEVDILSGAFMLMRREALEKAGLLDEDYFMYGEDIDLSYKITLAGYKNYYCSDTRIIHYKGESTKKSSVNYVLVFYKAMVIFARKNLSQKNAALFSFLIHIAIYFRAGLAIFRRLLNSTVLLIWDFIFLYGGMYYQKVYWEQNHKYIDGGSYPMEYSLYYMPIYILFWLVAVWLSGGYDRPIRASRIIRGVIWGTIGILVVYGLLPEELRTSRALILLGAIWAGISLLLSRTLLHYLNVPAFRFEGGIKRVAILGMKEERKRVDDMVSKFSDQLEIVGHVSEDVAESGDRIIGHSDKLKEIVQIFQIDELIIGGAGISAEKEIEWMSELADTSVEIRLAPADGSYIIGSSSIRSSFESQMNTLVQLSTGTARRNKRMFEIFCSIAVIVFSPLLLLIGNKISIYSNAFDVIRNRKNWVGFMGDSSFKKSVLTLGDVVSSNIELNETSMHQLNLQYAKHYSPFTDLNIIVHNLRNLGK